MAILDGYNILEEVGYDLGGYYLKFYPVCACIVFDLYAQKALFSKDILALVMD